MPRPDELITEIINAPRECIAMATVTTDRGSIEACVLNPDDSDGEPGCVIAFARFITDDSGNAITPAIGSFVLVREHGGGIGWFRQTSASTYHHQGVPTSLQLGEAYKRDLRNVTRAMLMMGCPGR